MTASSEIMHWTQVVRKELFLECNLLILDWMHQHPDCMEGGLSSRMSLFFLVQNIHTYHRPYLISCIKCIFHTICLMCNPEVLLLLCPAKSYNYKYKTSKKCQKSLPTICLMAMWNLQLCTIWGQPFTFNDCLSRLTFMKIK